MPLPSSDEPESELGGLRSFVRSAPDHPSAWIRLANALEADGRVVEAVDAWKKAERLVPDSKLVKGAISRLSQVDLDSPDRLDSSETATSIPTETGAGPTEGGPTEGDGALDLDSLITDLQSGRRKPTVDFEETDEVADAGGEQDVVISETLAGIYESQNHLSEAAKVYEALADRETDLSRADVLRAKAADIRNRIAKR